jgi:hypothetical protein
VADIVALESNVAAAHTMARLYLLASPSYDSTIGDDLREQLSDFFPDKLLESMHKLWIALVLDGARVSQDTLHWPTATAESDPRRGGVCYPPVAKFRRIKYYLDTAMPVVLRASSLKSDMDQDSSKRLFGVAQCLLATFDADGERSGLVSERLNALSVFVNLVSNDTSRQSIPDSEWTIVARHFVFDVLCGEEAFGNSGEAVSMVRYLIDLLDHLGNSIERGVLLSLALYTTDAVLSANFFSSEAYNSKMGEKEVVSVFAEHMVSRAVQDAFPASTSRLAESGHLLKLLQLLLTLTSQWDASGAVSMVSAMCVPCVTTANSFEAKAVFTTQAFDMLVNAIGKDMVGALLDSFGEEGKPIDAALAETVLMIWSTPRGDGFPVGSSRQLLRHMLCDNPLEFLSAASKIIHGDLASRGKIFASALFTNAILLLSQSSACRHPDVLIPLCQLLLAMYAVTEVDQRPEYLGVFIPALSTALLVNEGAVDFVLYGGRALTQVAATQPGPIRDCIQKLPEEHRVSLQRAMKASMDQQQTITSPGGTTSAPKTLKKIDMSKFSKK